MPPTNVAVTANQVGQVTLTWAPPQGATGYEIHRNDLDPSPLATVSGGSSGSFTETALPCYQSGGLLWTWYVVAVNGNGRSGPSSSVMGHAATCANDGWVASGPWTTVASLPTARDQLAAATGQDGRLYALGGETGSGTAVTTVEAYMPSTNSWSSVASMPTARFGLGAATAADGRLFAIGGSNPGNLALSTVEVYSPSTNSWAGAAAMPTARVDFATVVGPDGRIYAIGGYTGTGAIVNTVEAYTPSTNSWTTLAPMPTARANLAAAVGLDGRIYAIGGFDPNKGQTAAVEAYSPVTNSWTAVAPLSVPRYSLAAALGIDGRIYAIGGFNGSFLGTVEAYAPASNTWTTLSSLSVAREYLAAALGADGAVYALGGWNGSSRLGTVEASVSAVPVRTNAPHIGSVQLQGSGQGLQITVLGSGFGAAPASMPYTGNTPYFRFTDVSRGNWEAGYFGDAVTLNYTSWSDSEVIITGFGGAYGQGLQSVQDSNLVQISFPNAQEGASSTWQGIVNSHPKQPTPVPQVTPGPTATRQPAPGVTPMPTATRGPA